MLDLLDIPPFFAPRQACLRGITHHNGATSDAPALAVRRERARSMLRRVRRT
ncbi:hypothetical protein [Burkholderia cenocepacia]|uniref:hypothetical protein n=1 Tax=Burkholderia cenocepacia TaxID=95486 RepID=UPI002AB7183B|nr:hypothetical protein [Burkholderia cenocepacia]